METEAKAFRISTKRSDISEWRIAELYATEDNPAFFRDFGTNKLVRHDGKNHVYGLPYEPGFETSAPIRAWKNPCVWLDMAPKRQVN